MSKEREGDCLVEVKNLTKSRAPRSPFSLLKNAVLGKKYCLSLVFAGPSLTQKLNSTYRRKNKSADILSFPLSKSSGEIFINLSLVRKEASLQGLDYPSYVLRLFIHGLLHLKGMRHGSKMERAEKKFIKNFVGWK
jgi:probable rRNA maturation factor